MSRRGRALTHALLTLLACLATAWGVHLALASETPPAWPFGVILLEPRGLYGLALLPVVVTAAAWSLADLPRPRRALATALRATLVTMLACALARPASREHSMLTSTVFVADVSDSMADQTLASMGARVQEAYAGRGPHHVELVTFARQARRVMLSDATPIHLQRHPDGAGSDLEGALALARGLLAPGHLGQLMLLSDGLETHGDLLSAAAALDQANIPLFVDTPEGEPPGEVAITQLTLPEPLRVGEPFAVRVHAMSTRPRRARLRLSQNGLLNGLDGARDVVLEAGDNVVTFRSVVRVSGPVTYRIELTPEGPDRFPQNNAFERTVLAQGKPRVLYVESSTEEAREFSALLSAGGFDVDAHASAGLPRSAGELKSYDFVILSDVPRDDVPLASMQAIERYVEEGGGFMMAGGPSSFGLGGYRGSKLESLLPVRLDTERRRDQPNVALMLVIDKSGSMNGEKIELAKEAARATSALLASEDYLGVIGFDAEPTRVVRLASAENQLAIARGIGRLSAGGGTLIFPALDAAYADLASVRARIKHVILLTDGQTQENGIPLLVQNMHVDGITVSAIGLGDDVNRALIEEVARLGRGRAYFTADPASVPRLFVRETQTVTRSAAVEDYVSAQVASGADFLRGLPMREAPMLRGYVATRARPAPAQLVLVSDLGEPLLARMHVGLGWSLAWTSDVKPRWAAAWYRWRAHSAFWAQLIREHMRKHDDRTLPIEARMEGEELVATIHALDEQERFLNGLAGALLVREQGPPREEQTFPLRQLAPGRYEARGRVPRPGSYALSAQLTRAGKRVATALGDLAFPFPREYAAERPAREKLGAAAAATGGGPVPDGATLFSARGRSTVSLREHWSALLWACLCVFLADLGARRLRSRGLPARDQLT